jgi:hypothetical protein
MVVMWCKNCGALLGPRHPLVDWSTEERTGFCQNCERNPALRDRIEQALAAGDAAGTTADDIKLAQTMDNCPPAGPQ